MAALLAEQALSRFPTPVAQGIADYLILQQPELQRICAHDEITLPILRNSYEPRTCTALNGVWYRDLDETLRIVIRRNDRCYDVLLRSLLTNRIISVRTMRHLHNFLRHLELRNSSLLLCVKRLQLRQCRGQYAMKALARLEKCVLIHRLEPHFCISCFDERKGPGNTNTVRVRQRWKRLQFENEPHQVGHRPLQVVPKCGRWHDICAGCRRAQRRYRRQNHPYPRAAAMFRRPNRYPAAAQIDEAALNDWFVRLGNGANSYDTSSMIMR